VGRKASSTFICRRLPRRLSCLPSVVCVRIVTVMGLSFIRLVWILRSIAFCRMDGIRYHRSRRTAPSKFSSFFFFSFFFLFLRFFLATYSTLSPTHRKYYRTSNNCYVSAASVKELPLRTVIVSGSGPTAATMSTEQLPPCGPVPHLKLEDRPKYAPLYATRATAVAARPDPEASFAASAVALAPLPSNPPPPSNPLPPPPSTKHDNTETGRGSVDPPIIVPSGYDEEFNDEDQDDHEDD
jgi:hypothetical protein